MALERAREYELRQRQFEQQAVRFYRLAHHLLATEGGKYTRTLSGGFPMPTHQDGQEVRIGYQPYEYNFPFVVLGARISDDDGNPLTVVLSSPAENKGAFKRTKPEILPHNLYESSLEYFPSIDLRLVPGQFDIGDLIKRVPVVEFNVGDFDTKENGIDVYGKNFLADGQFNVAVPSEAFDEFGELVDLVKRLSADPNSYVKIYPKPKTPKLDKAHA